MPVPKVPHEVELKLELASGPLPTRARIEQALGADLAVPERVEQVESLYFDTPEGTLRGHGVSFRIRRNGKRVLQTIKCIDSSDLFDRGEWETDIARGEPDWKAAQRTDVGPLLTKQVRRAMKPLFTTRVRRTIYPLSTVRAEIELALDSGSIVADGRSEPVQELELELKSGDSSELFRLARELSRAIPARLCLKSKAERGYRLLNGGTPGAVKAGSVDLSPRTEVADAFRMIGRSCLAQIIGNDPAVETEHPEALHQMRIGLRRLRAATAFFSPILAGSQTDLMKVEFKWLTRELSPARDLDVYTSQVLQPVREKYQADPEFNGICGEFERRRAEAFGRAKDAIRSERYRQFLIDVAAWIQTGDWARAGRKGRRPERERDIKTYAAEQLNRRRKKILKDIERFDRLDAVRRHKLRIRVKKFRYASEFIASVFGSKRRLRRSLKTMKEIQDCLGALNDITAHEKLNLEILRADDGGRGTLSRAGAFLAGLIAGQRQVEATKLAAGAAAALDDFRSIKPFWK